MNYYRSELMRSPKKPENVLQNDINFKNERVEQITARNSSFNSLDTRIWLSLKEKQ